MSKKPLGYLGGDIMTFGSQLARKYEYEKFKEMKLPVDVYSPATNDSINRKDNFTREENDRLAEKITDADIERLWNSDFVVMSPEQSAIGSMCELGCLYGWKYMADKLLEEINRCEEEHLAGDEAMTRLKDKIMNLYDKRVFCHYFDIRTNHIDERDWRRSFSINQMLYGMVMYVSENGDFESFDEIMNHLRKIYGEE